MPVIVRINDKHLVALYNIMFSNMTDKLSHYELYPLLTQKDSNMPLK